MNARNGRQGALVGGSLLVAALSSACCWLPLLAVALGFSAVGVGSVFEAYRWPLVALAGGFVLGAFVLQLRTRRACRADGCAPPRGGLAWPLLGAVLVVGFAVFPEVLAATGEDAQPTAETSTTGTVQVREYAVTGMTCEGCTSLLVSHLEDQPEIASATVIYAEALARVSFVAGTSNDQARKVMDRVSVDWEGKYTFTPKRRPG